METGERVELAWRGPNHSPDNTYILFPDHDTLMFIDVVNAGWIPIYNLNFSDDVIGYTGAPAIALDCPWTYLISGHLGRVATRDDVAVHQQYIADIEASSREALARSTPGPIPGCPAARVRSQRIGRVHVGADEDLPATCRAAPDLPGPIRPDVASGALGVVGSFRGVKPLRLGVS